MKYHHRIVDTKTESIVFDTSKMPRYKPADTEEQAWADARGSKVDLNYDTDQYIYEIIPVDEKA